MRTFRACAALFGQFVVLIGLMTVITSCSSISAKQAIVGKWKTVDELGSGDITEFSSTGTYIMTYFKNGKTSRGTYTFMDSSRLEVTFDFIDDVPIKSMKNVVMKPEVCIVKIKGDTLLWTNPNGDVEHLERLGQQ